MDEQETVEDTTSNDVTLGEVYDAVINGFDGETTTLSDGFNMVGVKLDNLASALQSSEDSDSVQSGSVVLDQEQIDTLTYGIKVLTTEGFFLLVALAVICGLSCWRTFSRGWFR